MECLKLKVASHQDTFVALNWFSLIQAKYETDLYPLGIYKNNKMIGFILYDFDEDIMKWSMSRFMIDDKYQKQGLGKIALGEFIKYFYAKHGKLTLYTSANVDNLSTINLYEKFGFIKENIFEYEKDGIKYKEYRMKL